MKRISQLVLNIGTIEVNREKLNELFHDSDNKIMYTTGSTFVAQGVTNFSLSKVIDEIEDLCSVLEQDCIAMQYNNNNIIVYPKNTKISAEEQIYFNSKLFLKRV